jgi:hypothetical protein
MLVWDLPIYILKILGKKNYSFDFQNMFLLNGKLQEIDKISENLYRRFYMTWHTIT